MQHLAENKNALTLVHYFNFFGHKLCDFLSSIRFFDTFYLYEVMLCEKSVFGVIWPFYFRPNSTFGPLHCRPLYIWPIFLLVRFQIFRQQMINVRIFEKFFLLGLLPRPQGFKTSFVETNFSKFTTNFIIFYCNLISFNTFYQLCSSITWETHWGHFQVLKTNYLLNFNNFSTTSLIFDLKIQIFFSKFTPQALIGPKNHLHNKFELLLNQFLIQCNPKDFVS